MQELVDGLAGLPHARVHLLDEGEVPEVALDLDEAAAGVSALELMRRLEHGAPAVFADPFGDRPTAASASTRCALKDGEPAQVAERVRAALARAS